MKAISHEILSHLILMSNIARHTTQMLKFSACLLAFLRDSEMKIESNQLANFVLKSREAKGDRPRSVLKVFLFFNPSKNDIKTDIVVIS
jgi:hypothetical protein